MAGIFRGGFHDGMDPDTGSTLMDGSVFGLGSLLGQDRKRMMVDVGDRQKRVLEGYMITRRERKHRKGRRHERTPACS